MDGVIVVRDGTFVGCAAATSLLARQALEAIAKTARWQTVPNPSSKELFSYLKEHAGEGRTRRGTSAGATGRASEETIAGAKQVLRQNYEVAYIQHVPMEPRAAVAEWTDKDLIVHVCTANPFGVRGELAAAFQLAADRVQVIVPDVGGAFGGKHQGEAAVEAARLAKAAGRPVAVRWTREEEFTWAYFRPAALIEMCGALDVNGSLIHWEHTNINSGGSAVNSPYDIPAKNCGFVGSRSPLRQGSYRALAATANNFARESFMDELAHAAGSDPLAFRLARLKNERLRAVLETAAAKFGWAERHKNRAANVGVGLACGTEKGSYVAACAEVAIDRGAGTIHVRHICEVFEMRRHSESGRSPIPGAGCHHHGLGRGTQRGDPLQRRQDPQRQPHPLPSAAIPRRARVGRPPAEPPRPGLGRWRRDAHHRRRPGHCQCRVPSQRHSHPLHADPGHGAEAKLDTMCEVNDGSHRPSN